MNSVFASNLIKYFELLAAVTGLLFYVKNPKSFWFLFAAYLLLLFGMETFGTWLGNKGMYLENTYLYKWAVIPSLFVSYHFVFYVILKTKKILVAIGGSVFLLSVFFENLLLSQQHYYSISISLSIGCVLILVYVFQYFMQLIKSNDLIRFYTKMDFWFSAGLFVFYVGCFPYLTFFNSLGYSKNRNIAQFYNWVFIILNYIMYLSFTAGFIWSKRKP